MTTRKKVTRKKRPRKDSARNGHVNAGIIKITVVGGPCEGEQEMDASVIKLCAEQLERKHNLEIKDGVIHPTAGFAKDLSESLVALGYQCTPTVALHAWAKASEYFADLQKKTS